MAKYPGVVQGAVSPAKLQANPALVYVAQALGGGLWAKMMARPCGRLPQRMARAGLASQVSHSGR